MAIEAQAKTRAGTPIADLAHLDASKTLRVSIPLEVVFDRNYPEHCGRERLQPRAISWRGSPPPSGWCFSCTRLHGRNDIRCKYTCPAEGRHKKKSLPASDPHACQHVAVKRFPTGPRDNGEVYWQCALCGIDL
eukprot:8144346-Karenia_brevis.AAC.2